VLCTWVVTTQLLACAAEVGTEDEEGNIGVAQEALGSSFTIATVAGSLLNIGETQAIYWATTVDPSGLPAVVTRVVSLSNGVTLDFGESPSAAVSDADGSFVHVGSPVNDIVALSVAGSSRKVVDTNGSVRGNMLLGATRIYWADSTGVRKAPRDGGSPTTIKSGSNLRLLAIEGSTLYYESLADNIYSLRQISGGGNGDTIIAIAPTPFDDFSYDAGNFFWVTNSSSVHKLEKMSRTNGTRTSWSLLRKVRFPISDGTKVYFGQEDGTNTVQLCSTPVGNLDPSCRIGSSNFVSMTGITKAGSNLIWNETAPGLFSPPGNKLKRASL
jgi:hypothetical protein